MGSAAAKEKPAPNKGDAGLSGGCRVTPNTGLPELRRLRPLILMNWIRVDSISTLSGVYGLETAVVLCYQRGNAVSPRIYQLVWRLRRKGLQSRWSCRVRCVPSPWALGPTRIWPKYSSWPGSQEKPRTNRSPRARGLLAASEEVSTCSSRSCQDDTDRSEEDTSDDRTLQDSAGRLPTHWRVVLQLPSCVLSLP